MIKRSVLLSVALGAMLAVTGCSTFAGGGNTVDVSAKTTSGKAKSHVIKEGKGWKVTKKVLWGGKSDGVVLITIDNGPMQITVVPTRGMNIYEVKSKDIRLGWNSPVEGVVHPKYIDLESRGGLGWLEGFNEWMVRCGLEFAGHPGTDKFVNNTGDESSMTLTLHGKIGNIPATDVKVIVDEKPPHRIRVRGTVYEKFFYGPKLKLVAEISTVPGSNSFRIDDKVTNLGSSDQEFQVIYHGNFGAPLLEKDSKIVTPVKRVAPMNAHAAKATRTWHTYAGPTAGFTEEVYLCNPIAGKDGKTLAVIHNAKGNRGATVRYNTKQLPYLTIWKNTASEADGYVTGIEPATGYPFNRMVERKFGRVPKLGPGKTRRFTLDFDVLHNATAVKEAIGEVNAIQGDKETILDENPPTIPE